MPYLPDLLTKAYTRACVEWKEYEGVWHKVLSNAVVNEAFGIEFLC